MRKHAYGLLAITMSATFCGFTSKRAIDTWFKYNLCTNSGFATPSNYTPPTSSEPTNPAGLDQVLNAIKVDASLEVYPANYATVAFRNRPKVDITGTGTINQDIQDAIGAQLEMPGRVSLKFGCGGISNNENKK